MQAYFLVIAFLTLLVAQRSESARIFGTEANAAERNRSPANDAPWFCRGSPCPEFKTISQTQTYELREYAESTWISTTVESSNYEVAITKGFVPLYSYLKGNNAAKLQMDMAKPAITHIQPSKDFSSTGTSYTIFFYLPGLSETQDYFTCADLDEHGMCAQETAPKPLSKDVRVVTSPEQRFYVYAFGGFATGGSILNSALKLALALQTDSRSFDRDHLWSALYDAPTRLWGRHNEVMFSATGKADDVSSS